MNNSDFIADSLLGVLGACSWPNPYIASKSRKLCDFKVKGLFLLLSVPLRSIEDL